LQIHTLLHLKVHACCMDSKTIPNVGRCRTLRAVIACSLLTASGLTGGCVGRHTLAVRPGIGLTPVSWFAPDDVKEGAVLERWRGSVGPPVFTGSRPTVAGAGTLMLVSWNTALGAGNVERLVTDLQRERPGVPIVLLLQEVYRGGPEVPTLLTRNAAYASRLRGRRSDGKRDEVETIASALQMSVYYVPSMRNGSPLTSDEDRGNAILSTLPLSELKAFELPFERQRRVAVGATLTGSDRDGDTWQLRVVSAHLDNMAGLKRLWIASELGRVRQTRGLLHQLHDEAPLVLGGDFNTWFGFSDLAFRETARAFPATRVTDRRATFRGLLRLDHLFFRLPDGWSAQFRRADDNYGSDHYPLIATIDVPEKL
jgi:endonuclease/exonuclease/phosphatase family metal-dependent hydrolase